MFRRIIQPPQRLQPFILQQNRQLIQASGVGQGSSRAAFQRLGDYTQILSFQSFCSQEQRWLLPSLQPRTPGPDFSTGLLPLYKQPLSYLYTAPKLGIRSFSSKTPKDEEPSSNATNSDNSNTANPQESTSATSESVVQSSSRLDKNPAIKELVDSVDTTIKQAVTQVQHIRPIYIFTLLIAIIAAAPRAIRHMQSSDTDYDDLDPEDPVADLASFIRTEFLKEGLEEEGDWDGGIGTIGGLDTIVADLLKSPLIQGAVNDLVNSILTSAQFKKSCSILLKELWKDLVEDPETLKQVIHLLYNAIQDEQIKKAAVELVTEVFAEQEVLDELVELFQRLGNETKVRHATQELLVESAHNALNDPEILDHSMEFATDVVGDDVVQQTAGEALYNTLSYAVRPTLSAFLALVGAGLIVVSVVAFQHATSSEAQSLEGVLAALQQSEVVQALISLITLPWNILVACKDAVVWIVLLPFRLITGTLTGLGRAGNATVDAINRLISWMINLPVQLAESIVDIVGRGLTAGSDSVARHSRDLGTALSGSLIGTLFTDLADYLSTSSMRMHMAWLSANKAAADGAYAVEAVGYRILRWYTETAARAQKGWDSTVSRAAVASKTMQVRWVSTNRVVGDMAIQTEERLLDKWGLLVNHVLELQTRAVEMGLTREAAEATARQTQDFLKYRYQALDRQAERLGFYLESLVSKVVEEWQKRQGKANP